MHIREAARWRGLVVPLSCRCQFNILLFPSHLESEAAHEKRREALIAATTCLPKARLPPVHALKCKCLTECLPSAAVGESAWLADARDSIHSHMSNEGTGFFPGHASLAYFFFLGSGGRLASAADGCAVTTGAAGCARGAPAGSMSGAGLGR